jgi:hypothetical protein
MNAGNNDKDGKNMNEIVLSFNVSGCEEYITGNP